MILVVHAAQAHNTSPLVTSACAAMDSFLKQAASQVTAAADKASAAAQSKFGDSVAEQVLLAVMLTIATCLAASRGA